MRSTKMGTALQVLGLLLLVLGVGHFSPAGAAILAGVLLIVSGHLLDRPVPPVPEAL